MSMIRDLRAVVRPALRKSPASYDYGPTRDAVTGTSAVVDCAVYRDGVRCTDSIGLRDALETVRAGRASDQCDGSDGFVWIGLHEPTEAEFAGIAEEFGLPLYEAANHLTDDKFFDPLSGQQAYKCFACRVMKA